MQLLLLVYFLSRGTFSEETSGAENINSPENLYDDHEYVQLKWAMTRHVLILEKFHKNTVEGFSHEPIFKVTDPSWTYGLLQTLKTVAQDLVEVHPTGVLIPKSGCLVCKKVYDAVWYYRFHNRKQLEAVKQICTSTIIPLRMFFAHLCSNSPLLERVFHSNGWVDYGAAQEIALERSFELMETVLREGIDLFRNTLSSSRPEEKIYLTYSPSYLPESLYPPLVVLKKRFFLSLFWIPLSIATSIDANGSASPVFRGFHETTLFLLSLKAISEEVACKHAALLAAWNDESLFSMVPNPLKEELCRLLHTSRSLLSEMATISERQTIIVFLAMECLRSLQSPQLAGMPPSQFKTEKALEDWLLTTSPDLTAHILIRLDALGLLPSVDIFSEPAYHVDPTLALRWIAKTKADFSIIERANALFFAMVTAVEKTQVHLLAPYIPSLTADDGKALRVLLLANKGSLLQRVLMAAEVHTLLDRLLIEAHLALFAYYGDEVSRVLEGSGFDLKKMTSFLATLKLHLNKCAAQAGLPAWANMEELVERMLSPQKTVSSQDIFSLCHMVSTKFPGSTWFFSLPTVSTYPGLPFLCPDTISAEKRHSAWFERNLAYRLLPPSPLTKADADFMLYNVGYLQDALLALFRLLALNLATRGLGTEVVRDRFTMRDKAPGILAQLKNSPHNKRLHQARAVLTTLNFLEGSTTPEVYVHTVFLAINRAIRFLLSGSFPESVPYEGEYHLVRKELCSALENALEMKSVLSVLKNSTETAQDGTLLFYSRKAKLREYVRKRNCLFRDRAELFDAADVLPPVPSN